MVVQQEFAQPVEVVFRYLADPRNRPAWQSSLRRVEQVVGDGELGTTWTDVTAVGIRPRLRVTECRPYRLWTERGEWRRVVATLTLRFVGSPAGRTRVSATVGLEAAGLLRPVGAALDLLAPPAVRADLARAARLAGG